MPSFDHEAIVELIRAHPSVLAGILASTGTPIGDLVPDDATLSELIPSEYHADLVLVSDRAVVIVEVQLAIDLDKVVSWPGYVVSARRRHRRPAWLVVVTPSDAVARWASRGVAEASLRILPLVLGPASDVGDGVGDILALFLHPGPDIRTVAIAALTAAMTIDAGGGDRYVHIVLECIRGRDPALAEELMADKAFVWPRNPWLEQHDREVRAEGRAEGEARGLAEGEARGLAASVLTILAARGLPLSEADRSRIEASDAETLRGWLTRIVTVPSVESLLSGD